jgi:tetratricopeptide (TPR) repeat protein
MENDPLYQEGLKHFGLGQWPEAVACFTQLQATYPDDPRIKQFLETAQLRAAAPEPEVRREAAPSSWRKRAGWIGVIVVIALIGVGVFLAYQSWVVPVQQENARLARLDQLRRAAEIQIASGSYGEAVSTYQTLLNEEPGDVAAQAGLTRAQQLAQVADLYARALQAMNNGDQAQAARLLEQLAAIDPNYRDAGSLLDQIKGTQALEERFSAAHQQVQAGQWLEATKLLEEIRSQDRNFRAQEVADDLYTSYYEMAEQAVRQATTTDEIEAAQELYQKALSARPLDPAAEKARRQSAAFLAGAAAFRTKNWDEVILRLGPVYEQQPEYFQGQVRAWLFETFMTLGENFMAQSDPFSARDRFAQALQLAQTAEEKEQAQQRYDAADTLTTPTPTPRPTPTIRPTATPLPAGYVAPAWTRRPTGTPNPYPFQLINTTYLPNTLTGEGCRWAGAAGRIFDRDGSPLVLPTLGIRLTGPIDQGAAAGSAAILGESGWMIQFDVVPKHVEGFIQVYYRDQPVSDLIPFITRRSCVENLMMMDIQLVKTLPQ